MLNRKRFLYRALTVLMAFAILLVNSAGAAAAASPGSKGILPKDIITFGSYPQTRVSDEPLISVLNELSLSPGNTVIYEGAKYQRVYFTQYTPYFNVDPAIADNSYQDNNGYYTDTVYWFKFEPIQWRVLSNTNGELFVIADEILDATEYYKYPISNITWEISSIRAWLMSNFYNMAFSSQEKTVINFSSVVNDNNPFSGVDGGNDTIDKLFLLSYAETVNTAYGYSSSYSYDDPARQAQGTDYSKSKGLRVADAGSFLGNSFWWLRSTSYFADGAGVGLVSGASDGAAAGYITGIGVRPAMRLDLSAFVLAPAEGSGCVVNQENMFIYGLKTGITNKDFELGYIQANSNYRLDYIPDTGSLGTGTSLKVIDNALDQTLDTYRFVIFGDVSGDGNIDSIDAGVMVDLENYAITWDPAADASLFKAGDLNKDGNVDSIDAGIAVDTENYMVTINQTTGLAAPASTGYSTGDIITFGTYPQTRISDERLISELNEQVLAADNTVDYNGEKYQRVYFSQYSPFYIDGPANADNSYQDNNGYYTDTVYWFKFEPIQWRVLSNTNGELFVMAEKILNSKEYNQYRAYNMTWEICTMRTWLNNDFYNTAFSAEEKTQINSGIVVNADNPFSGGEGGSNTNDRLFLLSYAETVNPAYGFSSSYSIDDAARRAQATDFSKSSGLRIPDDNSYFGNGAWWFRSTGYYTDGGGVCAFSGVSNDSALGVITGIGVRPVMRLNLSSLPPTP